MNDLLLVYFMKVKYIVEVNGAHESPHTKVPICLIEKEIALLSLYFTAMA